MKIVFNPRLLLVLFVILGTFLRFYNLNWGAPFYFHPDERNIASAVTQLEFPNQLNPKFFAYGSLPIYSIYSIGVIMNFLAQCVSQFQIYFTHGGNTTPLFNSSVWQKISSVKFDDAILISRLFSASLSSILIITMFFVGKKLHSISVGLLTAFLTALSVGLIQYAHFGTFEIWLTFFTVLLFLACDSLLNKDNTRLIFITGILLGILVAIKVSHLSLIPIPLFCINFRLFKDLKQKKFMKNKIKDLSKSFFNTLLFLLTAVFIFMITNPFTFLDFEQFRSSMNYETGVAAGSTEVFYTHEFFDTTPIIFQFQKIYPFLVNPLITLLFLLTLFYLTYAVLKYKNKNYILPIAFYSFLFFFQAFLFVKWTRYMVPTIPFMYLIVSISLSDLIKNNSNLFKLKNLLLSILIFTCALYSSAYFITVLNKPDSRIEAANWAKKNIPSNSRILSESYDLGITAFNTDFHNIVLCDMYYLEAQQYPCNGYLLNSTVDQADYIILPSERLLKMSIIYKDKFPERYRFYNSLSNEKTSFELVYKTYCNFICEILYLGNTLYPLEQTVHVFDRPTVYLYRKIK